MQRHFSCAGFLFLLSIFAGAQNKGGFDATEFQQLIFNGINGMRADAGYDSLQQNEVLMKAAAIQAEYMAKQNKAMLDNKGKYKTTGNRVKESGGTSNAAEVVIGIAVMKGKAALSSKEVADAVLNKWKLGRKEKPILTNGNYVFGGLSAITDDNGKKVYLSVVMGSFNTFNTGADKRNMMKVPYTKKPKKMKPRVVNFCKNTDKWKDYIGLYNGLYMKGNKVFLKYDNLRMFKRLMRKPSDAIAVDVVQKEQYEHPDFNIVDNNLVSKGVVLKPMSAKALLSKNLIKGKFVKKLDVQLGEVPKTIKGDYELNLIIIQNGSACRVVTRSYIDKGEQEGNSAAELLLTPDTTKYLKPPFEPKSESSLLTFIVPFEKNKYDYKPQDIKPFLDALQEPDFIVEDMYVYAYSSIEGDSAKNAELQRKRAESIITAVKQMQEKKIEPSIILNDSWGMFLLEMEDTPYEYLTQKKKKDAIQEINTKPGLSEKLEPYLSKQRFAQIVMDITYDITGPKEEKFSTVQFNRTLKKSPSEAMRIMDYINKKEMAGAYSNEAMNKLVIPTETKNTGVLNNKVVYEYRRNGKLCTEEQMKQLNDLVKMDPSSNTIAFNQLFCRIAVDSVITKEWIDEVQKKVDAMYTTDIPKKTVDALNTELQFKIIDAFDTSEKAAPLVQACVEKVKTFYNVKESSWQNNLKLAYVFMRFRDFRYACALLEPFIREEKPDEHLLFAYISSCWQIPEKQKSKTFAEALHKARLANPDKYCKLFGAPFLSFQLLDNPFVKQDYNKGNCK